MFRPYILDSVSPACEAVEVLRVVRREVSWALHFSSLGWGEANVQSREGEGSEGARCRTSNYNFPLMH